MPTEKLTSRFVENVKSDPHKDRVDYFDSVTSGLSLRVSKSGNKSWVVYYRSPVEMDRKGNLKVKRFTLGKFPRLSLAEARTEANKIFRRVEEGDDPQKEKADAKRINATSIPDPVTVKDGIDRYVKELVHLKHKPRVKADGTEFWELERTLEKHVLTYMGGMLIVDVTRKDVFAMHRHIEGKSGPVAADRAAEALRGVFNWLDDEELVDGVPVIRLKNKTHKPKNHRVLNDEEIRAVWNGLDVSKPFGGIVRILLLTGQRRNEVAGMRWDELNLDEKIWNLPEDRTKNGLPHIVPLSKAVCNIIKDRDHLGEFVFTTTGTTPFSGFSRSKQRLDGRIGISDWTLHDLRRTFVTRLNEMGIHPHIVEAIVNHITGVGKAGVAGIYNKAQYLDQRKTALDRWSGVLEALITENGESNVLAFNG